MSVDCGRAVCATAGSEELCKRAAGGLNSVLASSSPAPVCYIIASRPDMEPQMVSHTHSLRQECMHDALHLRPKSKAA